VRAIIVAVGLFVAGCSDETKEPPLDLSSPLLYCPATPPAAGTTCDATATPYCDYGAEMQTCKCVMSAFQCGSLEQPDEGGLEGV
jgi:hypothetical protein